MRARETADKDTESPPVYKCLSSSRGEGQPSMPPPWPAWNWAALGGSKSHQNPKLSSRYQRWLVLTPHLPQQVGVGAHSHRALTQAPLCTVSWSWQKGRMSVSLEYL